jgi:hypothetical protein
MKEMNGRGKGMRHFGNFEPQETGDSSEEGMFYIPSENL